MKKFFSALLMLFVSLFLFACNNNEELFNVNITVKNWKDYTVDTTNHHINVNVGMDVESFNLDDIVFPEEYIVSFYDKDTKLIEDNNIKLDKGVNNFSAMLTSRISTEMKIKFTICINRLAEDIKYIAINDWKYTYTLNEKVAAGTLNIVYSDGHVDTAPLTESMFIGFDTTTEGKKTATVVYKGLELEVIYIVGKQISSVTLVDHKTNYFVNEEFVPGNILIKYADGTEEKEPMTLDMVPNFNTAIEQEKTIKFYYLGFELSYTYKVSQVKIVESDLTNLNNKYFVGDEFAEGTIVVKFNNASESITVTVKKDMVTGFDTETAGSKEALINVNGHSVKFPYTVTEVAVEKIEKINLKTTYFVGDEFAEGTIVIKFNNASESITVTVKKDMVTGFDTETAGSKEALINVNGHSVKFPYTVTEVAVEKIDNINLKTTYLIGETLAEGTFDVHYNNGTKETVKLTSDMITGFDSSKVHSSKLTITYKGITSEVNYEVKSGVQSIKVIGDAKYFLNEENIKGELEVTYIDGTVKKIPLTKEHAKDFKTDSIGSFTITLEYDGHTDEYTYTVVQATLLSITISEKTNVNYSIGQAFTEGFIDLVYDDTRLNKQIPLTLDMIDGFDTSKDGDYVKTVTYDGVTCEFKYHVAGRKLINIRLFEAQRVFEINSKFTTAKLELVYNNNTLEYVDITLEMLKDFDTTTLGAHEATVTYEGMTCIYKYTVKDILDRIEVYTLHNDYKLNDDFIGGVLKLIYSMGEVETISITKDMVSGFDTSKVGSFNMIVKYANKEVKYPYTVKEMTVESVDVLDFRTEFVVGTKLPFYYLVVTYTDKTTEKVEITNEKVKVTGFDTTKVGTFTVTFEYCGKSISKEYKVVEKQIKTIGVKELNNKYRLNDLFADGLLEIVYTDFSRETVALTKDMVSGFDTTKLGDKHLTVTYKGIETTFNYKVLNKVKNIEVKDFGPNIFKFAYFPTNVTMVVTFVDGTTTNLPVTEARITGYDSYSLGKKELVITYEDFTVTLPYEVVEPDASVLTLFFDNGHMGTDLIKGSLIENKDIKILYNLSNSGYMSFDCTEEGTIIEGLDTSTVGPKTLTVTWRGVKLTLPYKVVENTIKYIGLKNFDPCFKLNDKLGELELEVTYLDETKKIVPVTADMISGFDTSTEGENKTLTVTYEKCEAQVSYHVSDKYEIFTNEFTSQYYVGDTFKDAKLLIMLNKEVVKVIPLTLDMITGFDTTTAAKKTVTITYNGFTTTETIYVNEIVPVSAELITAKNVYNLGETYGEVIVKLIYNNNTVEEVFVPVDKITGFDTTTEGLKTMIYEYRKGNTLPIQYRVIGEVKDINVLSFEYVVLKDSKYNDGVLELIYANDYRRRIRLTEDMVANFDTTTLGNKTLVVRYENFSTEVTISVVDSIIDLPAPQKIDEALLIRLIKRIFVTDNMLDLTPTEIDALSDETIKACDDYLLFDNILRTCNLSNEQLLKMIEMFDKYRLNVLFNDPDGPMIFLMSEDNFNMLIDIITTIKSTLTKSQVIQFINGFARTGFFDHRIQELKKEIEANRGTEKEKELQIKLEYLEGNIIKFRKQKQISALVGIAYECIDLIPLIPYSDVMTIMKLIMPMRDKPTAHELYNIVTTLNNLLKEVDKLCYQGLIKDVVINICEMGLATGVNSMTPDFMLIDFALDNLGLITSILDRVTLDNIKTIISLFDVDFKNLPKEEDKELTRKFREVFFIVKPLVDKFVADEVNKNYDFTLKVYSIVQSLSGFNLLSFNHTNLLEIGKLDVNSITYQQFVNIINNVVKEIYRLQYRINLNTYDVLFKKGITNKEAFDLLTKYGDLRVVFDYPSHNVNLSDLNIYLGDVNTVGYHFGYIQYGYIKHDFIYYIYENESDFEIEVIDLESQSATINIHNNDYSVNITDRCQLHNKVTQYVYDSYIKLSINIYDDEFINHNYKEQLTLLGMIVTDKTVYKGYDINMLVAAGLDKTVKGIQYININGELRPFIYSDNLIFDQLNITIDDLEYLTALHYAYTNIIVDGSKLNITNYNGTLTYNDFISAINNLFGTNKNYNIYYMYESLFIEVDGLLYNIGINYHGNYNNELIEQAFMLNSFNDITIDMLCNNVKIKYNDKVLNTRNVINYLLGMGINFNTIYKQNLSLSIELRNINFGTFYIKDDSGRIIERYDSLLNSKNTYDLITSNTLTDNQVKDEFLKQQIAIIYLSNNIIKYTNEAYKGYFDSKYKEIDFKFEKNYYSYDGDKVLFVKSYKFTFEEKSNGNIYTINVDYSQSSKVTPKVEYIEIPDTFNVSEKDNNLFKYLTGNFQTYFTDEKNWLLDNLYSSSTFKINIDLATNKISFIITKSGKSSINVSLPFKNIKKDVYITQKVNINNTDNLEIFKYEIYYEDFNSSYISNNYSMWFDTFGYTGTPTVTISDNDTASINFNKEFNYIVKFKFIYYKPISDSILIHDNEFNKDFLYKNAHLFIEYDETKYKLFIIVHGNFFDYELMDLSDKQMYCRKSVIVYIHEKYAIQKDSSYESRPVSIYSLDLNEQYLKDNVDKWFKYTYNGKSIGKASEKLVSVTYNDNNANFDFGIYGTLNLALDIRYYVASNTYVELPYQQISMEYANELFLKLFKYDDRYISYEISSITEYGYYTHVSIYFNNSKEPNAYEASGIHVIFTDRMELKQVIDEVIYTEAEIDVNVLIRKIADIFTCYGYQGNYVLSNYLYYECNAKISLNGDIVTYDFGKYGTYTVKFIKST